MNLVVIIIGAIGLFFTFYYFLRYIKQRKIKKQKYVLEPILKLKIEDYVTISKRTETKGNVTSNITSYDIKPDKVYRIIREVKKHEIKDVRILNKLEEVLHIERKDLIVKEQKGRIEYYFNEKLQDLIYKIKIYLSDVL